MARRPTLALVVLLTLASVLLLPLRARAAMLPECGVEPTVTTVPLPSEPVCAVVVVSSDDVTGETSAAPICDPDGASAIAPQRILPVSDGRIDAAPGCGEDTASPALGTSPTHEHASSPSGVGYAVLDVQTPRVPRAPRGAILAAPSIETGALPGHEPDVYHPPRAR